jgi:hypothetical protein
VQLHTDAFTFGWTAVQPILESRRDSPPLTSLNQRRESTSPSRDYCSPIFVSAFVSLFLLDK